MLENETQESDLPALAAYVQMLEASQIDCVVTLENDKITHISSDLLARLGYQETDLQGQNPAGLWPDGKAPHWVGDGGGSGGQTPLFFRQQSLFFTTPTGASLAFSFTGHILWAANGHGYSILGTVTEDTKTAAIDQQFNAQITAKLDRGKPEPDSFFEEPPSFFEELTQQKRQEELEQIKEYAISTSRLSLIFCDLDWQPFFANPASLQLLGYEGAQTMPPSSLLRLFPNPEEQLIIKEQIDGPGQYSCETQVSDQSGQLIDIHLSVSLITDPFGKSICILASLLDIRARLKHEKEKEIMQQQLLQSSKLASIGTLSTGIAHELNNPLAGILGYSEIIEGGKQDPEKIKEMGGKIVGLATRMSKIINNLRSFARKSKASDMSKIAINTPINEAFILLQNRLKTNRVAVKLALSDQLPAIVGDLIQLESVFQNFIVNSCDAFMEAPGAAPVGERQITISTTLLTPPAIEIRYQDNAGGMPPEVVDQIFEPFFTTKPTGKGTGLGMSITYGVIKNHNAQIEVQSKLGEGTTFIVTFPIAV